MFSFKNKKTLQHPLKFEQYISMMVKRVIVRTWEERTEATNGDVAIGRDDFLEIGLGDEFWAVARKWWSDVAVGHGRSARISQAVSFRWVAEKWSVWLWIRDWESERGEIVNGMLPRVGHSRVAKWRDWGSKRSAHNRNSEMKKMVKTRLIVPPVNSCFY